MERRHILILPASQSTLPQDIARTQLGPCITLLLDLRTSPLCTPEDIGSSPNLLQDHLLACGTSSSTSAYIYYLGFLEQVFHTIARILGRLKEESGSADGALELWSVEMADPRAHWSLQQTIVQDHANAVRVCTHSVILYAQAGLTASKGGSSEVPRARFDGCRCRRCGELGLPSVQATCNRSTAVSSSSKMARIPCVYNHIPRCRCSFHTNPYRWHTQHPAS